MASHWQKGNNKLLINENRIFKYKLHLFSSGNKIQHRVCHNKSVYFHRGKKIPGGKGRIS